MYRLCSLAALLAVALPVAAQPTQVEDVATIASGMGRSGGGPFALYSLRDGRLAVVADAASRADSASTGWDIGFRGTTVIVNGGTSGPGRGAVAALDAPFEAIVEAPADSLFVVDGERPCPRGAALALCTGSGNGWYDYTSAGNLITPIPGRTLVVRLADGGAAKVRILSYYRGNPETPGTTEPRFYTFEYEILRSAGSAE